MSTLSPPPDAFSNYNSSGNKQLAIVVDIEGADYLTSTTIGRTLKYGDPYKYGDPRLVYGGLVPIGSNPGDRKQRQILSTNANLTISQTLEPEQGRASISTLSLTFIDKDQYMTQLVAPGIIIPEILGAKVRVWLGYVQTSFPEDYYVVWAGNVAQVSATVGEVTLSFTDPSLGNLPQIFNPGETTLTANISPTDTLIPVQANSSFFKKITGPDGTYDQSINTYLVINSEIMEYQQTGQESVGFGSNQFVNVLRGARNTTAAAASIGDTVDCSFQMQGHMIDLALKIQMSGLNGPYLSDQVILGLGSTNDPITPLIANAIVLKSNTDAVRDIGVAIGDYITVSSSPHPANNVQVKVTGFANLGVTNNQAILTDTTFTAELNSGAVIDVRSQYDTFPVLCGSGLSGYEVDVAGFVYYKGTYLLSNDNSYQFYITQSEEAKAFIESQIMLPVGAYTLTRQGKLSMGLTKPPIADDRTVTLNIDNVLNPQGITVMRAVNNRKFFNEIDWTYDFDDTQTALSQRDSINAASLSLIGVSYVLPIEGRGIRTSLGFLNVVENREAFLFQRYARGAVLIDIKTNFGVGNQIEAGDVVLLEDNGELQIPNMTTGVRDLGTQLFEVINRELNMKTGETQLKLQGGLGALFTDRYATVTPSSLLTSASTANRLVIQDSFGAVYPGQEWKKWVNYIGLSIWVHDKTFNVRNQVTTFVGFDPANNYAMILSPALGFTPQPNDILDLAPYSTSTSPLDQQVVKLVHAFLDKTATVVSGISTTQFTVSSGDASVMKVGMTILIHSTYYDVLSAEVQISDITGTTISISAAQALDFTPAAGQFVELLGFADFQSNSSPNGMPYRLI